MPTKLANSLAVVRDLTFRGVKFAEYEASRMVDLIAEVGPGRAAWFKDPGSNVLGERQRPVPTAG
jgi:hypothetical protein